MRTNGQGVTLAATVAVLLLGGCSSQVGGTAVSESGTGAAQRETTAGAAESTDSANSSDSATSAKPRALPDVGECIAGNDTTPVDCSRDHTAEVVSKGQFGPELPREAPDATAVYRSILPTCRKAAGEYLGNDDYDATMLGAWVLWADPDAWQDGDRWYRCAVAQLDQEGEADTRRGSVKGTLSGGGFHDYQLCSSVRPSKGGRTDRAPCDGPHNAEAFAAVPMGEPSAKYPTPAQFDAAGQDQCQRRAQRYVGVPGGRDDVFVSWQWPGKENWRNGFTNLTCYLETDRPVTRTLAGLGTGPLPN